LVPFPFWLRLGLWHTVWGCHPHPKFTQFHGPHVTPYMPLPLTTFELGPILQLVALLVSRVIMRGTTAIPFVLISWEGIDLVASSWEEDIQLTFPNFNLEEKVALIIARDPIIELRPQNNDSSKEGESAS